MPRVDQETSHELSFDRHDLAQIVRECVAQASVASPSVPVEVSCPPILPAVVHPEAFAGALRILVDVACRTTGEGLSATVKAIRGAEGISVHVIQRGSGDFGGPDLDLPRELVALHGGILWAEPLPAGGTRVSFVIPDDPPALEGEELEAAIDALEHLAQRGSDAPALPEAEEIAEVPVVGLELLDDPDEAAAEVILDVTDFRELVERDDESADASLPDAHDPDMAEPEPPLAEPADLVEAPEVEEAVEASEPAPIQANVQEAVQAVPEPPPATPAEPPDPPAQDLEGEADLLAAFDAGFDAVEELAARVERQDAPDLELYPEPPEEPDQAPHLEEQDVAETLDDEPAPAAEVVEPKRHRGWRRWRRSRREPADTPPAAEGEAAAPEAGGEPTEIDEVPELEAPQPEQAEVFGPPDPPAFLELDAGPSSEVEDAAAAEAEAVEDHGLPVESEEAPEPELPAADVEPEPVVGEVVEPEVPEIEDAEPEPEIEVAEPEPELEVAEPEPELEVAEPEPELEVAEPEPQIEDLEPELEPQIEVAEPEIELSAPEPELEPEVPESESGVVVPEPEPEEPVVAVEPEPEVVEPPEPVTVPEVVAELPPIAEPEPALEAPALDEPIAAQAEEPPTVEAPEPVTASPPPRKASRSRPKRRARRWLRSREARAEVGHGAQPESAPFFVSDPPVEEEEVPEQDVPPAAKVPATIPVPEPEPEIAAAMAPSRPAVRKRPERFVPDPLHPATQMLHSLVLEYDEDPTR